MLKFTLKLKFFIFLYPRVTNLLFVWYTIMQRDATATRNRLKLKRSSEAKTKRFADHVVVHGQRIGKGLKEEFKVSPE